MDQNMQINSPDSQEDTVKKSTHVYDGAVPTRLALVPSFCKCYQMLHIHVSVHLE